MRAAECLKSGGKMVIDWLAIFKCTSLVSTVVPGDWVSECVLPFYKGKGDKCECRYCFSHVSLLSVAGKVYDKVLVKRIREGTEGMICDDQGGLRKQRGSMDQIFTEIVMQNIFSKSKDVY